MDRGAWRITVHRVACLEGHFPGGPVVKNLPSSAGEAGSTRDRGTEIPRGHKACVLQLLSLN